MKRSTRLGETGIIVFGLLVFAGNLEAQTITGSGTSNRIARFSGTTVIHNSVLSQFGSRIGLGTTIPSRTFHLVTSSSNDGIRVNQTTTGAAALDLYNTSSGGHKWALFSTGNGNFQGSGNFSIYDYSTGRDRLLIEGATGNIGIGTTSPLMPLHIVGTMPIPTSGPFPALVKLEYTAPSGPYFYQGSGLDSRVYLSAVNGFQSSNLSAVKGVTIATCTTGSTSQVFYGVWGEAIGDRGILQAGVYGRYSNPCGTTGFGAGYGGYFDGDVYTTGTYTPSDEKLKEHIETYGDALQSLMLLKPKQYEFRTTEFPSMNLPHGKRIGFIEQDFEKVFPQLTRNASSPVMGDSSKVTGSTDFKAINYTGLIPVLTAALQEQQRTIENLESRLAEVERTTEKKSITNDKVDPSGALIQMAPNPANDQLSITLAVRDGVQKTELVIFSMNGQEAIREQVLGSGLLTHSIPVSKLKNATYICSLLCDGTVVSTSSFVVSH